MRTSRDDRDVADRQRKDLEGRLECLKRMFEWDDLTEEAYLTDRHRLQVDLASLSATTD